MATHVCANLRQDVPAKRMKDVRTSILLGNNHYRAVSELLNGVTPVSWVSMSEADREARLRSTLDSLLEGAQIIDRQWRYAYINPAAARHGGTTVDALLGRSMIEAFPGIDQTDMFSVLRRAM